MMPGLPSTFQAIGVIAIALLPGALYIWTVERTREYLRSQENDSAGRSVDRTTLPDRIVRFIGASAIFHALFWPVTLRFFEAFKSRMSEGQSLELRSFIPFWMVGVGYVVIPVAAGYIMAHSRRLTEYAGIVTPEAWDYLWSRKPNGIVRIRLKSGKWVAGAYGVRPDGRWSWASPQAQGGDIYLSLKMECNPNSGKLQVDPEGNPYTSGESLLIRWDEIEYLLLEES